MGCGNPIPVAPTDPAGSIAWPRGLNPFNPLIMRCSLARAQGSAHEPVETGEDVVPELDPDEDEDDPPAGLAPESDFVPEPDAAVEPDEPDEPDDPFASPDRESVR